MANRNVVVYLENVWKKYRVRNNIIIALKGVSLQILENEYICLIGPNGSGKSTLLKIIAGLIKPDKGRVNIFGRDPFKDPAIRSYIGLMPQEDVLFDTLSIKEHIELLEYVSKDINTNYIYEILEEYGFSSLLDRKPYQLSGGQRRVLQLMLILARKPRILLLDEPTAFLDTRNTAMVLSVVNKLYRTERLTIIMSTHDEHVCSSSQRIIRIRDGVIFD